MSRGGSALSHDLTEAQWEALALDALGELGWEPVPGSSLAPGTGERESWAELILPGRLRDAVARLNPQLPPRRSMRQSPMCSAPARGTPWLRIGGCTS